MQKLAEVCIKRPVFATMLVMAFVVVGAASWFRLGVDRFPAVDLPTVNVRVELPGASSEEVETQVAQRLEEQINTIQGIQELRSISGPGAVIVIVTFNLNRQIDVAAQDVRDKVAIAVRNLPREILPPVVSKFDNDQAPVVTIALSGERSLRELTEIADKVARPQLERSAGVGEVRIVGGLPRAVNVWVDPDRLAAYQIPITNVRDALVRQNADLPGGNVTAGLNEASLRTMGRVAEPRSFNDLVVATLSGVPVRVRDIGYAEDGTKEQRSAARLNGVPTVVMEVRRQSGENTVAVIEGVKGKLSRVIFDPALVTQDFIDEEFRINNSAGAKESFATLGRYIGEKLDDDLVGERLAELSPPLPTLLLWGAENKTVPLAVGESASRLLPGSRLVVLQRAAHTLYYERADDFNAVLCDFLAGTLGRHQAAGVEYR